jgi:hypothetical protein
MTDNKHPITPPLELIREWALNHDYTYANELWDHIATQAARWGADQELNECCKWLPKLPPWSADDLRKHRRPKPPSLKEQALEVLNEIESGKHGWLRIFDNLTTIRRALESLPN